MNNLQERINSFIEKAKIVHADQQYDYSLVPETYVNNRAPVKIIDREIGPDGKEYGVFEMTPSNLLKGKRNGNRKGEWISKAVTETTEWFIERAMKAHPNENLDYSQVVYKGAHEKVYIIDHDLDPEGNEYGGYWQDANAHLKGCGHPQKHLNKRAERDRLSQDEFLRRAKSLDTEGKYDFSKSVYKGREHDITITCKKHGDFTMNCGNFFAGKGCPVCGHHASHAEDELYKYLVKRLPDTIIEKRYHGFSKNMEIDIYIPEYKFAIEYNGLRWHSEQFGKDRDYHINKLNVCKENGVVLFHIFEDEWLEHKDLVLSKINHFLKLDYDKETIMARKCKVIEIKYKAAKPFLDTNHIQGATRSTKCIGCYYHDSLVGVMVFIKESDDGKWELSRFATDINYRCVGVGGKLFKHFVREFSPTEVKTFLDRRYETNAEDNLYTKLGFVIDGIVGPDYRYTNGSGKRYHKFGFRKQILAKRYGFDLSMTEREMTEQLGYYKIYDCGLVRYVWKANHSKDIL